MSLLSSILIVQCTCMCTCACVKAGAKLCAFLTAANPAPVTGVCPEAGDGGRSPILAFCKARTFVCVGVGVGVCMYVWVCGCVVCVCVRVRVDLYVCVCPVCFFCTMAH
eukprot:scpid49552/ scgid20741/ 